MWTFAGTYQQGHKTDTKTHTRTKRLIDPGEGPEIMEDPGMFWR